MKLREGFTLVELVVVMLILGALAAIAIPKLQGSDKGAKFASMKADARQAIANAQSHYSQALTYTGLAADCDVTSSPGNGTVCAVAGGGTDFTVTVSGAACANDVTYASATNNSIVATTCD